MLSVVYKNENIKHPTLTFITPCLNIEQVILAWSGAHMIDDIAFKYESNWSRC